MITLYSAGKKTHTVVNLTFQALTSTKIVHSCVRPFKAIKNHTWPYTSKGDLTRSYQEIHYQTTPYKQDRTRSLTLTSDPAKITVEKLYRCSDKFCITQFNPIDFIIFMFSMLFTKVMWASEFYPLSSHLNSTMALNSGDLKKLTQE